MTKGGSEVTVLLVEDNRVDRMAVRRAFKKARILNEIVEAQDGVEALAILRGTDERPALDTPYLVLLDLNMPRMSGLEFLAELRADPELGGTIVFVLTTSHLDEDRARSYELHVAGYISKAKVGSDFVDLIAMLDGHWRIVVFP